MNRTLILGLGALIAAVSLLSVFAPNAEAQRDSDGRSTILLIGGDAGPQRIGLRTDSMMVASLDQESGRTVLFGVPRNLVNTPLPTPYSDLFVCGCWESLLNELYPFAEANPDLFGGGPNPGGEVLMRTIGHLLGLEIDYFALVDLPGFVRVIDALGGVTIDVPVQETVLLSPAFEADGWQQFIIPVGRQHMDGRTALAYARTREDSGDYERMARQRCIIGAIARQADVSTLLLNYPSIANDVADAVTTNVPLDDLPMLIEFLGMVDFDSLYTVGFTTDNFMAGYAGQPYYPIPSQELISQTVNAMFTSAPEAVAADFGTLPASCSWQ